MWLASEAPERVERLVLCCTSALLGPPDTWETRARTIQDKGIGAIADAVPERWFTPAFREDRPDVFERAARMLRGTPGEGYAGCCEAIRDMDLRDRLGEILAPTLVIAGAHDLATPPEHAELIRDSIPEGQIQVISQAAHLANVQQPGAITAAILEHLASGAGRGAIR
jgi:3-oxoadipate enol-lactonase